MHEAQAKIGLDDWTYCSSTTLKTSGKGASPVSNFSTMRSMGSQDCG